MKLNLLFKIIGLGLVVVCMIVLLGSVVKAHKGRNKVDGFAQFSTVGIVTESEYVPPYYEDFTKDKNVESAKQQNDSNVNSSNSTNSATIVDNVDNKTSANNSAENSANSSAETGLENAVNETGDMTAVVDNVDVIVFVNNDVALTRIPKENLDLFIKSMHLVGNENYEFVDYISDKEYIIYKDDRGTERVGVKNNGYYTSVLRKYSDI